ncbi:hypothetical protein AC482_04815 [miscellaneous Crenarchaeota group-15 archaeon DG-45]|uniref:Uncharacterized protein n=1 Tax=miscellaneous Crenarchaeota group-15 archaeon DG-45 TaxID=1685127 RepID=A0A0M0BNV1_9ARCH|nr:MAG: hypothetical protein AC482_04815 [miscellaneous Crenarchaeota group-15 archaeon DG-45]
MSNYQMGAFEALEWAWHMLRGYKDRPRGVDEARRLIQEVLSSMGEGAHIDFNERIREQDHALSPLNNAISPPGLAAS